MAILVFKDSIDFFSHSYADVLMKLLNLKLVCFSLLTLNYDPTEKYLNLIFNNGSYSKYAMVFYLFVFMRKCRV